MAAVGILVVLAQAVMIDKGFSFPAGSTQNGFDTGLTKVTDVSPEDVSLKRVLEFLHSLDYVLTLHIKGLLEAKVEIDAALSLGHVSLDNLKGIQSKLGSPDNGSKSLQLDNDAGYTFRNNCDHNVSYTAISIKSDSSAKVSNGHQDDSFSHDKQSHNMSSKGHWDDVLRHEQMTHNMSNKGHQDDSFSHDQQSHNISSKGHWDDALSHDQIIHNISSKGHQDDSFSHDQQSHNISSKGHWDDALSHDQIIHNISSKGQQNDADYQNDAFSHK